MSIFALTLRPTAALMSGLVLGAVSAPANAAPSDAAPSDALVAMSISIGDYIVSPTANLGVNTQYGSADSGDISSHQIQIPRLKADFLLGHSQGFALDYYGYYRQYADTFNRSVSNGNTGMNITGNTSANVGLDVANASYKWWFGSASDVFGVGLGAGYYRIRTGLDASAATSTGAAPGATSADYSADAVAPLVQIGWRHAFSPNTRLYVDISGVEKNGGNASGHIYNTAIGAEWYFAKHLGVGAEYGATRVTINDDGNHENLTIKLDGPTIFLKTRF